jgi:hypothetical protein
MTLRLCIGLVCAGLFGSSGGCGSNSAPPTGDGGLAGASAFGGVSGGTAGTTGVAGTVGTGIAGTTGVAGTTGIVNGVNCPATAPADNSMCTVDMTRCTYGADTCSCNMRGGNMLAWNCGATAMMQVCPATQPANATSCTPGYGNCPFSAALVCDCANDTQQWACWDPADCPATQPANDATCSLVGMACNYPAAQGQRRGARCQCTDTGWDCGGRFDPNNDAGL